MKINKYLVTGKLWLISVLLLSFYCNSVIAGNKEKPVVKIGIIADVHDDPQRLQTFIDKAKIEKPDFIIQLGDMSNGKAESNEKMLAVWNSYPGKKYHVLGNHEFDYATKEEIVKRQEMSGTYYSFDCGEFHFIVLDCNFIMKDGQYIDYAKANYYIDKSSRDLIHPEQVAWLKEDINKTDKRVIIFSHETFDDITIRGSNPVPNRMEVRNVIREINNNAPKGKMKVIACFAGHDHLDHYNQIDGIHFFAVNSAWGFKQGLKVKDALYEFVTLNNKKRVLSVKGVKSEFAEPPTDKDYGHYPKDLILPYTRDWKVKY